MVTATQMWWGSAPDCVWSSVNQGATGFGERGRGEGGGRGGGGGGDMRAGEGGGGGGVVGGGGGGGGKGMGRRDARGGGWLVSKGMGL